MTRDSEDRTTQRGVLKAGVRLTLRGARVPGEAGASATVPDVYEPLECARGAASSQGTIGKPDDRAGRARCGCVCVSDACRTGPAPAGIADDPARYALVKGDGFRKPAL